MHNSYENQWEYYIVEGIMDTYAKVSPFWVIVLTWLTKNKVNQKKQILRVERVIDNILNSKFICFSTERYMPMEWQ